MPVLPEQMVIAADCILVFLVDPYDPCPWSVLPNPLLALLHPAGNFLACYTNEEDTSTRV